MVDFAFAELCNHHHQVYFLLFFVCAGLCCWAFPGCSEQACSLLRGFSLRPLLRLCCVGSRACIDSSPLGEGHQKGDRGLERWVPQPRGDEDFTPCPHVDSQRAIGLRCLRAGIDSDEKSAILSFFVPLLCVSLLCSLLGFSLSVTFEQFNDSMPWCLPNSLPAGVHRAPWVCGSGVSVLWALMPEVELMSWQ